MKPTYQKRPTTPTAAVQLQTDGNLPAPIAERGITDVQYRVLTNIIFPGAKNPDVVALAWDYCKARNLDIMKKMVHIVPYGDKEQILPGIAEIRSTATRTGEYAGKDSPVFGDPITQSWNNEYWENSKKFTKKVEITFPEWCEVAIYRFVKGQKCKFVETVFWLEACATTKSGCPNTTWQRRVKGQLAKCAEAASLRSAFPEEIGGIFAAEEMEGKEPLNDLPDVNVSTEAKASKFAAKNNEEEAGKTIEGEAVDVGEVNTTQEPSTDAPTEEEAFDYTITTPEGITLTFTQQATSKELLDKAVELLEAIVSKKSRLEFIRANMGLIRFFLKGNNADAVTLLHGIADEGK